MSEIKSYFIYNEYASDSTAFLHLTFIPNTQAIAFLDFS